MRTPLLLALCLTACEATYVDTGEAEPWDTASPPPPPASLLGTWDTDRAAPPAGACATQDIAFIGAAGYTDLALAIASAAPFDIVWICPGTYIGPWQYYTDGPFELRSTTGVAADVIMEGAFTGRALIGSWDVHLRIRDLTFQNFGYAPLSTAIINASGGEADLLDSKFINNFGIVRVGEEEGRTIIRGCTFEENDETVIEWNNAVWSTRHPVHISHSSFINNEAPSDPILSTNSTRGLLDPMTFTFRHVDIMGNHATRGAGSAIYISAQQDVRLGIQNSRFIGNYNDDTGLYGPPINNYSEAEAHLRIVDSVFAENKGGFASALGWGAQHRSTASFIRSAFVRNEGTRPRSPDEGAIYVLGELDVYFDDVALGTGRNANIGADITGCPLDLGAHTTGYLDAAQLGFAILCPQ